MGLSIAGKGLLGKSGFTIVSWLQLYLAYQLCSYVGAYLFKVPDYSAGSVEIAEA